MCGNKLSLTYLMDTGHENISTFFLSLSFLVGSTAQKMKCTFNHLHGTTVLLGNPIVAQLVKELLCKI
jgi:hypothetical protein